ncbi:43kDa postsynaptic protein [Parasponia andersonii]|uniref:RING-type E3 ubiquitin transferase n=1 Tax=Parasponia andersonii TaxID=3476 RepID=A0A2P5AD23_PARAD|nr:43kDa postsynaptic protein [Parasponia andersonii]
MASLFLLLMPLTFSLLFFFVLINSSSATSNNAAEAPSHIFNAISIKTASSTNSAGFNGDTTAGHPSPSPPSPNQEPRFSPFRPSIAVIVGVLTTMFSITFLLLLYAKHCKRGDLVVVVGGHQPISGAGDALSSADRKNSGIDRAVVESLPVFRFGSLMGHKEGLECAVCLTRFESSEVLRLLPKCKHAFHVECVDTWLDAHSTCPLCRYRVDPEDILLVLNDAKILPMPQNDAIPEIETLDSDPRNAEESESDPCFRRVSGRHSSAGERGSNGLVQIVVQKPGEQTGCYETTSFRRSLDDWSSRKKRVDQSVAVGCFDWFEHRIIVSPGCGGGLHQRWSDVQPSELLYLRTEMIISDSRRFSSASGSRPSVTRQHLQQQHQQQNGHVALHLDKDGKGQEDEEPGWGSTGSWSNGRRVINSRSVSEITGISRAPNDNGSGSNDSHRHQYRRHQRQRQQQAQAGLMSRWVAWVSQLRPAVGSERSAH